MSSQLCVPERSEALGICNLVTNWVSDLLACTHLIGLQNVMSGRMLSMGETMMRIAEVRNKQRTLLTAQEREPVAWKEGSEICFLTHTEEACLGQGPIVVSDFN